MSVGSIAVSGIGYGALAVALSGFASAAPAVVLVGEGIEQGTELGTVALWQPLAGVGLSSDNLLGTGYITQIGLVPEAGPTSSATTGIKKPGIPANTPAWLRTSLEIYTGRRGNAITIPAKQALTFSATPTKEECEALNTKVDQLHDTLKKLITRFDS